MLKPLPAVIVEGLVIAVALPLNFLDFKTMWKCSLSHIKKIKKNKVR